MTIDNLKAEWERLTSLFSDNIALTDQLWAEIQVSYGEKHRHYHNLEHLCYMFSKAFEFKDHLMDFDTLSFSIFYHDLIYNVKRSDNEEKSAIAATDRMTRLGVPIAQIAKSKQQIIDTKAHQNESDNDTRYLLDFDLAILGENTDTYLNYTKKIRKEYGLYPNFLYKPGRRKVLKHFLQMKHIFKTQPFIDVYEEQARRNISTELEIL